MRKTRILAVILFTFMMISACASRPAPETALPTATLAFALPSRSTTTPLAARMATTEAATPTAFAPTAMPTSTETPPPTETTTLTPVPTVASLKAQVTADLLSCRYGPGPDYLFLYGLRKGANIKLIGRTNADNWHWAYVDGRNKCWVNTKFLEIQGDWLSLPIVYPGQAKLPVSPYYPPTDWVGAQRDKKDVNLVEVSWNDVPLRAGDEEDAFMQHYVVEVWRCEGGQLLFEPLATNDLAVTFVDEPGCNQPSHGRVFVQEKHGFAGPTDIPWPPYR